MTQVCERALGMKRSNLCAADAVEQQQHQVAGLGEMGGKRGIGQGREPRRPARRAELLSDRGGELGNGAAGRIRRRRYRCATAPQ